MADKTVTSSEAPKRRVLASNGYVLVRTGKTHHLSDIRGYAYEHRIVAERKIGRPLLRTEIVHHINGDKTDNSPENLEVVSSVAHHCYEHRRKNKDSKHPDETNQIIECACGCGAKFNKYDSCNRARRFVTGHNLGNRNGR